MRLFNTLTLIITGSTLFVGTRNCSAADGWVQHNTGMAWVAARHKDNPFEAIIHPDPADSRKAIALVITVTPNGNKYLATVHGYFGHHNVDGVQRYTDRQVLAIGMSAHVPKAGRSVLKFTNFYTPDGAPTGYKKITWFKMHAIPLHNGTGLRILFSVKLPQDEDEDCDDPPAEDILEEEPFVEEDPPTDPIYVEETVP